MSASAGSATTLSGFVEMGWCSDTAARLHHPQPAGVSPRGTISQYGALPDPIPQYGALPNPIPQSGASPDPIPQYGA
jgi:hypothetical protein